MNLNFLKPYKISTYIAKDIFKNFLLIFFCLFLLFFAVDFFETTKDIKAGNDGIVIPIKIVLYRTPNALESILHFILLLSGLFTFYKMSNNSEIVVMRSCGRSIFQIIKFPALLAFVFGIIIINIYNPISAKLNIKSERMKNIYFKKDQGDLLELANGIWFKQKDLGNPGGEIIIRASNVYKDTLSFKDVTLIYLDKDNRFVKRINSKYMRLNENNTWTAKDNYIIKEGFEPKFDKIMTIQTNLTTKFISRTIKNDYESIFNIPFIDLRSSIKDLKESGFNTLKFEVRLFYLMTIPFLFAVMIFISANFGITHTRTSDKYLSVIKGIAVGFLIFISHNIISELSNAQKLTIIDGSILITTIYILLAIFLLIKKDLLSNYNAK